jgi:O-methyltransferase
MKLSYRLKTVVWSLFRKMGYEIFPRGDKGGAYETILPTAMYSPWNIDEQFQKYYQAIKENTLVDIFRCYGLWSLVQQAGKLSEGALLEVGVWRGGTGALIAQQAALSGIDGIVYLCDTFRGVVKTGPHDSTYTGGEHHDTSRRTVEALVDSLQLNNVQILQGIFPDETSRAVKSEKIRFCHVDVDVYQSAKDIVDWVWPRLVPGGIVVFDDYASPVCDGLTKFVNEEMSKPDRLMLYNLNGHGLFIKR